MALLAILAIIMRYLKLRKKGEKQDLLLHLVPICVRINDVIHLGVIDLDPRLSFGLTKLFGVARGNDADRLVNKQYGPYMARMFMNSGDIELYYFILNDALYPDARTCNTLAYTINPVGYAELSAMYNLQFRTGLFTHEKRVAVSGNDINLDISPGFFAFPATFLD